MSGDGHNTCQERSSVGRGENNSLQHPGVLNTELEGCFNILRQLSFMAILEHE